MSNSQRTQKYFYSSLDVLVGLGDGRGSLPEGSLFLFLHVLNLFPATGCPLPFRLFLLHYSSYLLLGHFWFVAIISKLIDDARRQVQIYDAKFLLTHTRVFFFLFIILFLFNLPCIFLLYFFTKFCEKKWMLWTLLFF